MGSENSKVVDSKVVDSKVAPKLESEYDREFEEFYSACVEGDFGKVKQIFDKNIIYYKDYDKTPTILFDAYQTEHLEIVEWLIDNDTDNRFLFDNFRNALNNLDDNNYHFVKWLISKIGKLNCYEISNLLNNYLSHAEHNNKDIDREIVISLLDFGAAPIVRHLDACLQLINSKQYREVIIQRTVYLSKNTKNSL